MDCVNHSGVNATAYCQNCGRALCANCVSNLAGGQVLCQPCWTAWQSYQQPFVAPPPRGPNPSTAAVLGLIPGVGAMYNGQFIKGLIHVVVFAVLIAITDHYGIFGLFVAAWVIYQSFEAYHTARAMRDGQPLPDPLGLNELGNLLNPAGAGRVRYPEQTTAANSGPAGQETSGGYRPPYAGGPYQAPYQQAPFTPPAAGFVDPANPEVPPVPPLCWRRKQPIGAIVLIALGALFLLGQLDIFSGRMQAFTWPLALIAWGVWLIVRRLGDSQGGPQ